MLKKFGDFCLVLMGVLIFVGGLLYVKDLGMPPLMLIMWH